MVRNKFTVEPGRCIHFNGRESFRVDSSYSESGMSPYQADQMTRLIVRLLNKSKIAKRIAAGDWKVADALED